MGFGSDCCSCKNIAKSAIFDIPETTNDNNTNDYENDSRRNKEIIPKTITTTSTNFNKNGSRIVNAKSFKQSELRLEIQQQQEDEFENMFNQLSNNSGNSNNL